VCFETCGRYEPPGWEDEEWTDGEEETVIIPEEPDPDELRKKRRKKKGKKKGARGERVCVS